MKCEFKSGFYHEFHIFEFYTCFRNRKHVVYVGLSKAKIL